MARWGQARVEVLALRQEIADELARGLPVKQTYDGLVKSGRITVTYNGFRRQVQPIRDDLRRGPAEVRLPSKGLDKVQTETPARRHPSEHCDPAEETLTQGFKFNSLRKAEDFF